MNNEIFISYSRRDMKFVTQLHQYLLDQKISAWFDQTNIGVGTHWRTEIVEGIRDCEVFVLVLSPDSTASVNVRKEVDLAERYQKPILPIMWRMTEIPIAMEYQLAGIQYLDFSETVSEAKMKDLADMLSLLLGGMTVNELMQEKKEDFSMKPPALPAIEKNDVSTSPTPVSVRKKGRKLGGRGRKLGGLRKKQKISPLAIGGLIISGVVTSFGLDIEDQDYVNNELKWLFSASDHFLKIRRREAERTQPIPMPIPEDAERFEEANNRILDKVSNIDLQIWENQVEAAYRRINTHLKNLNILLEREARMGEAGLGDLVLQNELKLIRSEIVKTLQSLAQMMNQIYGVWITSPDQLTDLLDL